MSEMYSVQTHPGHPWPGGHGWPAHAADPRIGYVEIDRSGRGHGPFGYLRITAAESDDRLVAASQAIADALGIPSGESIYGWAVALRAALAA